MSMMSNFYFKRVLDNNRKRREIAQNLAAIRHLIKLFSTPRKSTGHMTIDQYVILNKTAEGSDDPTQLRYDFYDPYVVEERLYPDAMRERLAERDKLLVEEAKLLKQLREISCI